ncbi:VAN3-binding protein [Prunus persica]|uniref:VAN3-binding protein n=1 Tax=Prunus persica TaxID=3760 RepID=UPI0009AB76B5|nr:VAN3-binding protein [Prunus persica]
MEEMPGTVRPGRSVSFKTQHQSTNTNGKLESWHRTEQCLQRKQKTLSSSSRCSSSEIPQIPVHAMEFLCRSWSPSAYNFQQMFTSSDLFGSHDNWTSGKQEDTFNSGEPEEKLEIQVIDELPSQTSTRSPMISRVDDTIWMNSKHTKGWLGGKSLISIFGLQRVKKKDDIRLHTASVHAALSVTRLAAAIASVASNCKNSSIESAEDVDPITGDIVASAAALVTTVCAEAAESLGAQKTNVSSAINSGLAIQTTDDMITLTAAAATCLRGVAALKARATGNAYFPRSQNLLQVKAELSVVTPSGSRTYGWACIYSKHSQLMLSLQKKHLGFLATRKEYKILHVMEGTQEAQGQGNLSISLRSNNGNIKLLFKDETQSLVWTSSISSLLQMHN